VASSFPASGRGRAVHALHRAEDAVLAILLGAMILLAPLQIALRGLLGSGIAWVDPLLRVLVLWLGLLGAVAASREGRQITIDVISRVATGRARAAVAVLTNLFTSAVTAFAAYHATLFVASEYAFESVAFSGIPSWVLASVIPFAFGAIALRHAVYAALDLRSLFRGEDEQPTPGAPSR
jgi:TRAP-type C4-dicarboxylate transport system permease small subunit